MEDGNGAAGRLGRDALQGVVPEAGAERSHRGGGGATISFFFFLAFWL
jgi:hypothetical protein